MLFLILESVGDNIGKKFIKREIDFKYRFIRKADGLAQFLTLLTQCL